jgi:hypothetical protein
MTPKQSDSALTPAFRSTLSPQLRRKFAAVQKPLTASVQASGNEIRTGAFGAPRGGADSAINRRLAKIPQLTLEEVTIINGTDIGSGTYLFTTPEPDDRTTGAIENALDEVSRGAGELPVPPAGVAIQVTARMEPAGANPLCEFFTALEAVGGAETVHVRALHGRRYDLGRDEVAWGFEIQAVASVPRECATDDSALTHAFQKHLGSSWKADARLFTGEFIDTLAGEPSEPFAQPPARE